MTEKKRDGIKEINKVCKAVLKLQDSDFEAVELMIDAQEGYSHPFKCATAGKINDLSSHNRKVMAALYQLRDVIQQGE